jgi:adenylate kinase
MAPRPQPNILITGTPGTGKTTTSEMVAQATGLRHINVGDWVKEKELHSGWDEHFQSFILDEDKVCDALEDVMASGGNVVDHHGCDFFPERWVLGSRAAGLECCACLPGCPVQCCARAWLLGGGRSAALKLPC